MPPWFAPQRLVVTGSTGWLGRTALALSRRWWGGEADMKVTAFGSREGRAEVPGGGFAIRPLAEIGGCNLSDAAVLHFAFLTKDRLAAGDEAGFLAQNMAIDEAVSSAVRRSPPAGLFVASSGAARIVQQGGGDLYGLMKLVQEQRFAALRSELPGVAVLVGRVWSVAGPFINKPGAYALADFLLQAKREGRIRVAATSPVYRSYLHVEDLVTVVLATLAACRPVPSGAIDLAGSETVEMGDVAYEAARATGLDRSDIERGPVDLARRSVYVGDPTLFRDLALAADVHPRSFRTQVEDTRAYLDERSILA